jgi:chemotaxis protein MotA
MAIDRGTFPGGTVAAFAIAAGMLLGGGNLAQILQPTAALIVLGGTLGAVLIQFPWPVVREAFQGFKETLSEQESRTSEMARQLLHYGAKARRGGLLSLEAELEQIEDPFRRRCLMLAIDSTPADLLRGMMEIELDRLEERGEQVAKVWEAAAGFSPTMGILGAVLGLIQVMQRLDDISSVGKGIAVAFVATLYGVGAANLLFLPVAGKLRFRARARAQEREMTVDAACLIAEGANPRTLRERLDAHMSQSTSRAAPVPVAKLVAR